MSREFTDSTDSTEMIHKRMRYEIMVFNNPIIKLRDDILGKLIKRLEVTTESIKDEDHIYQRELILNSVYAFYLDISNQIDRIDTYDTNSLTHQESIINRFIELLVKKYRTQHKADFYASELGITPHYLSLLLKRITTQTASDFIYEMIFSEARNLLKHSKLSIQEIAAELNFSDQSSFGKFFKKKSGISPKEFRNKV